MAEPIEMPFGLKTQMSHGNRALDGRPDPLTEIVNFEGKGRPIVKYTGYHVKCGGEW